ARKGSTLRAHGFAKRIRDDGGHRPGREPCPSAGPHRSGRIDAGQAAKGRAAQAARNGRAPPVSRNRDEPRNATGTACRLRPAIEEGSMTTQDTRSAKLTIEDKTYEFPILSGTAGPDVIDIRRLYSDAGVFTFDPGYTSTGSCASSITYIDGDKGELMYRGYPIEQLAEKSHF